METVDEASARECFAKAAQIVPIVSEPIAVAVDETAPSLQIELVHDDLIGLAVCADHGLCVLLLRTLGR